MTRSHPNSPFVYRDPRRPPPRPPPIKRVASSTWKTSTQISSLLILSCLFGEHKKQKLRQIQVSADWVSLWYFSRQRATGKPRPTPLHDIRLEKLSSVPLRLHYSVSSLVKGCLSNHDNIKSRRHYRVVHHPLESANQIIKTIAIGIHRYFEYLKTAVIMQWSRPFGRYQSNHNNRYPQILWIPEDSCHWSRLSGRC